MIENNLFQIKSNLVDKKIDKYTLYEKLGQGQFGIVYKAQNTLTNKIHAIKKLKKSNIERNPILKTLLQTEVSIMNTITHPNIIHLYEFLESVNSYYLVIDYCNRGDFNSYLKSENKKFLEEEKAVYFLKQIANGFQELRKHKILHRDFKLDNLFIHDDILIIGDFGLSRAGVDLAETFTGTPLTMAYEILKEKGIYNSKADLWSVGIVYYQMLYGKHPFFGLSKNDLLSDIDQKLDAGLSFEDKFDVSNESKDLIRSLIERDPVKRIDWEEFFVHSLFSKFESKYFKSNSQINLEFDQNKLISSNYKNVQFMDDKTLIKMNLNGLDLQPKAIYNSPQSNSSKSDLIAKEIKFRYNHEKNKILFMVFAVKQIQKEIKNNSFKPMLKTLMNMGIFLLKKAFIINNLNEFHLKQGNNIYNLNQHFFEEFKNSKSFNELIEIFSQDSLNLMEYFKLLKRRCQMMKIIIENNYFLLMEKPELNSLDAFLKKWYEDLLCYLKSTELNEFSKKDAYLRIMVLCKYCINSEKQFLYLENSLTKFNWDSFYKEFLESSIHDLENKTFNLVYF